MGRRWVTGWKLDEQDRAALLARFVPRFRDVVADHVTLRTGTDEGTLLPRETRGEVVGEIDDEHDEAEDPSAQIAIQADGQYVVDALTPIGDFNERFGATFSDEDYDTIGGLVTEAVGHLPEVGDELALDRFMFRVARADARRVQAFHVTVLPPDAQDDA